MQLSRVDTLLTADSVEWCSGPGSEEVLACGTYQLEDGGRRRGSLRLLTWQQETRELKEIMEDQTTLCSQGILDMKWCVKDAPLLALAGSDGYVSILRMDHSDGRLTEVLKSSVEEEKSVLCLSLDWAKERRVVAVSDSLGCVSVVEVGVASAQVLHRWRAHEYEAWIVALGHDSRLVYSGGDDCRLCAWDTRVGVAKPIVVSKWHQMGVCSLQIHPTLEHILASGSYDETVALWDIRCLRQSLKDVSTGGGVWRVKWHQRLDVIATASMHNGCHIVKCNLNSGDEMAAVCSYKEHDSLAYGVDWYRGDRLGSQSQTLLASCSFYDHSLHVWTADIPT